MAIEKELDKKIIDIAKIKRDLEIDLSKAVANILKEYGITGDYIVQVYRSEDYGQKEPFDYLRGIKLEYKVKDKMVSFPIWCLIAGASTVENPEEIRSL